MIIVCQSLGTRPILVLELLSLVPRVFGTTFHYLSVKPLQLLPPRNIWRHISLIWRSPHRYRHFPWPLDVTELFPRFSCWTLIWVSRHWAWLSRGYWGYRNLIDWLIVWVNLCLRQNGTRQCYKLSWTLMDRNIPIYVCPVIVVYKLFECNGTIRFAEFKASAVHSILFQGFAPYIAVFHNTKVYMSLNKCLLYFI